MPEENPNSKASLVDVFFHNHRRMEPLLISLVIPVYNEEANLPYIVDALSQVRWPAPCEWVFINDGSTDRSLELLRKIEKTYANARLIDLGKNCGKGSAIQRGIDEAQGSVIAIQDADMEYDPNELPALIRPILKGQADVVFGARFGKGQINVHRTLHRMVNLFLTAASNIFSGVYLKDMETCYKVFRADLIKSFRLTSKRFGFDPEVTAYIAKFRLRMLEYPVSYCPRSHFHGKKIGWKDGIAALWFILRYNLFVSTSSCLRPDFKKNFQAVKGASPQKEDQANM